MEDDDRKTTDQTNNPDLPRLVVEAPPTDARAAWESKHRREVCAQALESLADYVRQQGSRSHGEIAGVWAVVVTSGRASMRTRWMVGRGEDSQLHRLGWLELQGELYGGLAEAEAMLAPEEPDEDDEAGSGSGPVTD